MININLKNPEYFSHSEKGNYTDIRDALKGTVFVKDTEKTNAANTKVLKGNPSLSSPILF